MRLLLSLALCLPIAGCAAPREPESLVDHGRWADADEDHPFSALAPPEEERRCGQLAVFPENFGTVDGEPSLHVDLDDCNYAAVTQPTLVEIPAGDFVIVRMWRAQTTFATDEPTEMGVAVGETIVWQDTFPNPGDSGLVYEELTATDAIPAGTNVTWFLWTHAEIGARHGGNSVNLIEVSRNDPAWEEE